MAWWDSAVCSVIVTVLLLQRYFILKCKIWKKYYSGYTLYKRQLSSIGLCLNTEPPRGANLNASETPLLQTVKAIEYYNAVTSLCSPTSLACDYPWFVRYATKRKKIDKIQSSKSDRSSPTARFNTPANSSSILSVLQNHHFLVLEAQSVSLGQANYLL